MTTALLDAPVRHWACPSCQHQDRTQDARTPMHDCGGLRGLLAPLVEVPSPGSKPDAIHRVLEREDNCADADRIMSVRTDHGDGHNDLTLFPETARMVIRAEDVHLGTVMNAHVARAQAKGIDQARYLFKDPSVARMARIAQRVGATMAWSTSNMNAYYAYAMGTNAVKPSSDSFKVALFGTSVTPAQSTTAAVTQYAGAGSTWSTGNESSGTGYTAGGVSVTPVSWAQSTNVITFSSSGSPQWTTVSVTTYGCLVYDTTVSNQAISWNYFGGQQTITAGTLTIGWNASGILTITC